MWQWPQATPQITTTTTTGDSKLLWLLILWLDHPNFVQWSFFIASLTGLRSNQETKASLWWCVRFCAEVSEGLGKPILNGEASISQVQDRRKIAEKQQDSLLDAVNTMVSYSVPSHHDGLKLNKENLPSSKSFLLGILSQWSWTNHVWASVSSSW